MGKYLEAFLTSENFKPLEPLPFGAKKVSCMKVLLREIFNML
jgi:hypothetical protein